MYLGPRSKEALKFLLTAQRADVGSVVKPLRLDIQSGIIGKTGIPTFFRDLVLGFVGETYIRLSRMLKVLLSSNYHTLIIALKTTPGQKMSPGSSVYQLAPQKGVQKCLICQ